MKVECVFVITEKSHFMHSSTCIKATAMMLWSMAHFTNSPRIPSSGEKGDPLTGVPLSFQMKWRYSHAPQPVIPSVLVRAAPSAPLAFHVKHAIHAQPGKGIKISKWNPVTLATTWWSACGSTRADFFYWWYQYCRMTSLLKYGRPYQYWHPVSWLLAACLFRQGFAWTFF